MQSAWITWCLTGVAIAVLGGPSRDAVSAAVSAFQGRIATSGAAVFRSNDGKAYRMDNDTELVFQKDEVHMLLYGLALADCRGTYDLAADGRLVTKFEHCELPVMTLEGESDSLLLRPERSTPGNAPPSDVRGGWPFRMLSKEAQAEVLQTLKELRDRAH